MKNIITIIAAVLFAFSTHAQDNSSKKTGWFINPEMGAFFHPDHTAYTLGGTIGLKFFNDHLKVGWQFMGRPGPINSQTYTVAPLNGQTYKGQSTITLRADHGAAGVYLAPVFHLNKMRLELPLSVGQMGAGFYLTGDDRLTPDGDRVSVWEDRLMDGQDAGFSMWYEVGARAYFPLKNEHLSLGLGVHYSLAPDWETYVDPTGDLYHQRFRCTVLLGFESLKK